MTPTVTLPPASDILSEDIAESDLLTDYYSHPKVLEAFGWPRTPPQPAGYTLEPFDEALLTPVKSRKPFWRS
jgi:hypothetical protein